MGPASSKVLKTIGWIELVVAASILYMLMRVTRELFWPGDQSQTHGEWLQLVTPLFALLLASTALLGVAAVRSWPCPWWWQLLAAAGLIIGVLFTIM